MKKFAILLMAFVVTMLGVTIPAFALTEGDWEFKLLNDEVTVTKYIGKDTHIVVPSTIYGAPVTKVGDTYGILGDTDVVSLTLPNTVKEIDKLAWFADELETVILPEGIEVIPRFCFNGSKKLKSVSLPSTIKRIEGKAFSDCRELSDIIIPAALEYIGEEAFKSTALTKVDFSPAINLNLENCGEYIFYSADKLKEVKLPPSTTAVPSRCFIYCKALEKVDFNGAPVRAIKYSAFGECVSLKSIILPATLKIIDDFAFSETGLEEVVIPYGVEKIDGLAFCNCKSLKSLYIPDTAEIERGLFQGCPNAIAFCGDGSKAAEVCKKNEISYLTDNSVNSGITVLYNGTRISFHKYNQNPDLINSRTLVPLRSIFEAMGADVQWIEDTSTVIATRKGVKITLQIGSNKVVKNNESITIDTPPMLINDRTMVPVRVIAEAFGANVSWNDDGKTVIINE